MRRKPLIIAAAALACVAAGLAVVPHFVPGQSAKTEPGTTPVTANPVPRSGAPKGNAAALPVSKVVLFTSGVGYFQRQGQVDGDAHIQLSFPVQDINDLLKSMVLRDLNGGKISTVSYDSHDPIEKTLGSFAVNLSGNPAMAEFLNQTRGEKVTVTWRPSDQPPTAVTGSNLGVEKKKQSVTKEAVVEVEYLNVWSKEGLRSFKLAEVSQVQFQNPALTAEVERALEVVAQSHDKQKKGVSLFFAGKSKRTVQVGYVVEHPVWKTSYRLVLSPQGKPFLQGWAMVENPTDEDWSDVHVSLVSGRPVSFRMDLYQPLYVPRPLVQLEMFANLRPLTYEGQLDAEGKQQAPAGEKKVAAQESRADKDSAPGEAPPPPKERSGQGAGFADSLQQTTQAAAQGVKLGDQFQYVIDQPVSVPRQKSALVPIVNAEVQGSRVSIFNEQNLAKHPMLGLKVKNITPLHLMQGPVTVFAEDSYAGDALLGNVEPGEERLLSYAVDLAAEVKTEAKKNPEAQVWLALTKGILHRTVTLRDTKTYTVKNRADKDKLVVLEHPIRAPEFALVTPAQPPSKTQSFYRFELNVPADAAKSFEVVEEKKVVEEIILTNTNDQTLVLMLQSPGASAALKAALQKAVELKAKLAKTQQEITQCNDKIKVITEEQARQRENMKVIPQTEPLYKKYLDKFLKQEEQIETLRGQIEQHQATVNQQRQEYENYVLNLTVKKEQG